MVEHLYYSRATAEVRVPPEMVDYTIDFLHSDTASLKSCSLVSRACCVSAQHHLFKRFVFDFRRHHDFQVCTSFLETRVSLTHHIRELSIRGTDISEISWDNLCSTIEMLPSLCSLSRYCIFLRIPRPPQCPTITSKHLNRFTITPDFASMGSLGVLAAFPSIREVQIFEDPLFTPTLDYTTPEIARLPANISSITIEGDNALMLPVLLPSPPGAMTPLETLDIGFIPFNMVHRIYSCLPGLGESLRHLRLDITPICTFDHLPFVMRCLNLSQFARLETLHLRLLGFHDPVGIALQWRVFSRLLSQTPPSLRNVIIAIGTTKAFDEIITLPWTDVFKTVPAISRLRTITFQLEVNNFIGGGEIVDRAIPLEGRMKDALRTSMNEYHVAGKLRFL